MGLSTPNTFGLRKQTNREAHSDQGRSEKWWVTASSLTLDVFSFLICTQDLLPLRLVDSLWQDQPAGATLVLTVPYIAFLTLHGHPSPN